MQNVVMKKIYLLWDFAAGVYLSETQNPIPSPLHTAQYTCVQHIYSHREGGRGDLNQREGERGNSSQSRVENTNMTACISGL